MTAIELNNISVAYRHRTVLEQISFSVPPGAFYTIIGPNGSGKTTLLKALSGLLPISTGHIQIRGKSLQHFQRRELARQLAIVPQQADVSSPFTVKETILMGRSPHIPLLGRESTGDFARVTAAMRYTDLLKLANRKLSELSGGERQRVMIARAICQEAKIILLDEPTSALDFSHQIRIMDLMKRLCKEQGTTVVMVSHDLNLAAMYSSEMLLLHQGKISCSGSPEKVMTPQRLQAVFNCHMQVDHNPLTGAPRVLPQPGQYQPDSF